MKKSQIKIPGNIWINTGIMFLIAGFALTSYNLYSSYKAKADSGYILSKMEISMKKKKYDFNKSSDMSDGYMPRIRVDRYGYIGEIRIKSLGMALPVMDTWDYDRLKKAPCRFGGSIYENNMIIGGHNFKSHFGSISYLNKGDKVEFIDAGGRVHRYRVSDIQILKDTEGERLEDKSEVEWNLSLFTCTLSGKARYAVRCVRI